METTLTNTRAEAGPEPIPFAIKVLRRMNPLVMRLLSSRAHRVLSGDLLVFEHRGRKTGRTYQVPLSYVTCGDDAYCVTRPRAAGWWRNVAGGADVVVTLRGRRAAARAETLPSDDPRALEAFTAFLEHNPKTASMLYNVDMAAPERARRRAIEAELPQSVVVRVVPTAT